MNIPQMYIIISIVVLVVIVLLLFVVGKKGKGQKLTPLAGLAFGFLLAGLFLGDNRLIGYGLMGVGVILAVVDMLNKSKHK